MILTPTNLWKMMMPTRQKLESGQVIVIIAIMMTGLLAMVGLAIDGGDLYFRQRDAQNATDAAALAAAMAQCTGTDVESAARRLAKANGFEDGVNDVVVDINFLEPTQRGRFRRTYVEVIVYAKKPPYFIQVVYDNEIIVTARSVGVCISTKSRRNKYYPTEFGLAE